MWQWITAINHTNMKNVLSIGITSSSQQPYTKTTHEWYNAMSKDVAEAFVKSLIPSSAYTGKLVILSGCELTGTNPGLRTVSDGWVWYSGEIFRVNAGTFTTGVGEIGVWSINTSSTNLTFSDNASKPVHQEKTLVFSNGASGSELFDEDSSSVLPVITPYEQNKDGVITRSFQIGTWNMDSSPTKFVPIAGIDDTKIVELSAFIISDTGSGVYNKPIDYIDILSGSPTLSGIPSGSIKTSGGVVAIDRVTGGVFDSTDYNSTSQNRGYVVVKYLP